MPGLHTASLEAPGRLGTTARGDFLLAWHNAAENGGGDPAHLWNVYTAVAEHILTVLKLAGDSRKYPGDIGFEAEIAAIWRLGRGPKPSGD